LPESARFALCISLSILGCALMVGRWWLVPYVI
jgi:hypothetical protein